MAKRWHYLGDMNLENGGYWIRRGDWSDYADCVQVTAVSDIGGPDNQWLIESGSIYIGDDPARIASALSIIGISDASNATWLQIADAMRAYHGIDDRDVREIVQIGKTETIDYCNNAAPFGQVDTVLRGNARLANYVRREYLAQ